MTAERRVVVTGCGVLCALGQSTTEFAASLRAGRSGIAAISGPVGQLLPGRVAGCVPEDPAHRFRNSELGLLDPVSQYALLTGAEAIAQSCLLSDPTLCSKTAVFLGTGMGGVHSVESAYVDMLRHQSSPRPLAVLRVMNNAAAAHLSIRFGLHGPNLTYSAACASSGLAIGEAFHAVRAGRLPCALVGGAEACIVPGVMRAWESMRVLASMHPTDPAASCRPFSRNRTGIVLGEGAAMFLLETLESATRRGVRILCELLGYGATADASHIANPCPDGQAAAMRAALDDAGLGSADIDYLNAHGTATKAGDVSETRAIKRVFCKRAASLPISSTKSVHGHLLGAAGALGFAAGVAALNGSFLPATMHLEEPDPECDLDYVPNQPRAGVQVGRFMSNSFAFGGSNATIIAGAYRS